MESTLYTDGHGVKVTTSRFVANNSSYLVDGILNASIHLIKAVLAPALLLIMIGLAGIIMAAMNVFSGINMDPFYIANIPLTPERIAFVLGIVFLLTGLVWALSQHDRYAVHIVTAEGAKEPVVSRKKDYVNEIVVALQSAIRQKDEVNIQRL